MSSNYFCFHDPATTEIYTLSLHDALPISLEGWLYLTVVLDLFSRKVVGYSMTDHMRSEAVWEAMRQGIVNQKQDRKSTRLNSSHGYISYAVFCLKKKKKASSNTGCRIP